MSDAYDADIISTLTKKLFHLRSQKAIFGSAYIPTHIELDIQETERQLEQLVLQRTQYMFDAQGFEVKPPQLVRGLITAVSLIADPESLKKQAAFQAIEYHRPTLRHCWLIATSTKNKQSSEPTAQELKRYFEHYGVPCSIHIIENGADLLETQILMQKLLDTITTSGEFTINDLICDITSGTKPMSAGMVLACGTKYPMQYMLSTDRNLPSLPVLLQVDFAEES